MVDDVGPHVGCQVVGGVASRAVDAFGVVVEAAAPASTNTSTGAWPPWLAAWPSMTGMMLPLRIHRPGC